MVYDNKPSLLSFYLQKKKKLNFEISFTEMLSCVYIKSVTYFLYVYYYLTDVK